MCESYFPFSKILKWILFEPGKLLCTTFLAVNVKRGKAKPQRSLWGQRCYHSDICFMALIRKVNIVEINSSLSLIKLQTLQMWKLRRFACMSNVLLCCTQHCVLSRPDSKRPHPTCSLINWWKSVLPWLSVSVLAFVDLIFRSESHKAIDRPLAHLLCTKPKNKCVCVCVFPQYSSICLHTSFHFFV